MDEKKLQDEMLTDVSGGGSFFNSGDEWVCPDGHCRQDWTPPSPAYHDSPQAAPLCPTCQKPMKLQKK